MIVLSEVDRGRDPDQCEVVVVGNIGVVLRVDDHAKGIEGKTK